jgi:hypothetical protein
MRFYACSLPWDFPRFSERCLYVNILAIKRMPNTALSTTY